MEEKYKNRILKNLKYLVQNTCSLETLCVQLVSQDQLTISELQVVKSQPSDEQKCTQLYTTLIKKPNNAFQDLLEALEETENSHIAKKLKVPCEEELVGKPANN